MTPIAGPSLWTLLVLFLFSAAVIDLVSPSLSSSFSASSPTTLPTTTTTTTNTPKILNLSSTTFSPSTNTSSVHTFSFTYSSAKKNHSETTGGDNEDDLAEAESSYALEEDNDEDNGGEFDGTFDEDSGSSLDDSANFDHLNDLLTRSALSPEVSPSTADHYQVMNNRSASLKNFYDALTAQDNAGSQDDSDSVASASSTSSNIGTDDDETEPGNDQKTIRLPSITTIVGGKDKDGLENRQDFLLPGSMPAGASSSSPSSFNYHRQQQLALYHQLSQMVQNSIANARGLAKTKGNSYVAAAGTGKKLPSTAAAAGSLVGGGKSKKLQIVYIKVPLLNLLEKGPRAADYSGIEGVSGDTDYDTSSGGGGLASEDPSPDGDGGVQQTSSLASNHDANALSAIAQLASSQLAAQPVSSTTAQLFQSLMNLKANYLQQNGSSAASTSSGEGGSLSDQQLQDLYTPWTPVSSNGNSGQSKLVSWSSSNTLGPSNTKSSDDSYSSLSSASSPKPTYIGQQIRHRHHQVSSSFQGSKSTKEDPDTSSSSSYSSYSRYPMQSTAKTSTSTTTTTTTTTPSPYHSKYRYNSPSSSSSSSSSSLSSFSSKFPSSSFGTSFSNSSSPSKYWSSYWNSTTSNHIPSFKTWSSYSRSHSSNPSTSESAPPPSRTTTAASSENSQEYSGVTSKPSAFSHHHGSHFPPHNHVYQPSVHGAFSSTYLDDEGTGNSSERGKKRHLGLGILPIVIQIDTKALREEQEQAMRSGRGGSNGDQPIRGTGGLNLRSILQQLDSSTSGDNLRGGHIHYNQPGQNFNSNRGNNYQGSASSWNKQIENGGNLNNGPAYGNSNDNNNGKATATITIEKPYPGPVSNADQIDDSQWPGKVEFIASPFAKNNQGPNNNYHHQHQQDNNYHHQQQQHQSNFNSPQQYHHQGYHNQNPHHSHHNNHHPNMQQHISWNDNQHYHHRQPFGNDYMTSASSSSGSSPDNYNNRRRPGRGCQRQQPKKKPPCSRNKSQFKHSNAVMLPSASNIDFDDGVFFSRLPGFADGTSSSSPSSSAASSNFFSRRPVLGGALSRHLSKSRRQKAFQKSLQSAFLTGLPSSLSGSWATMPLPEGSSQALQNFYSELLNSAAGGGRLANFETTENFAPSTFLNFPPPGALETSASVSSPVFNQPPPAVLLPPISPQPPPPAVIAAQLAVAAAASGQLPPLPPLPPQGSISSQTSSLPLLKKDTPNLENKDPQTAPQKGVGSSPSSVSSRFRFWSPFAAAISRTDKLAKQLTTFKGKSKGVKGGKITSSALVSPTSTATVAAVSSATTF